MPEIQSEAPRCETCDVEMELIYLTPRTVPTSPVRATYNCPSCDAEITKQLFDQNK